MMYRVVRGVLVALVLAACGDSSEPTGATAAEVPPLPGSPTFASPGPAPALDPARVAAGEVLYMELCAECHGTDLLGAADWQVPNADGSYPPPPQDSSGHTWHHADDLLVDIVGVGSDFSQSRMPSFGDRLSRDEILTVLDFIKSSWGPQERQLQWEQTVRSRGDGS